MLVHFERSRDSGATWEKIGPIGKGPSFDAILLRGVQRSPVRVRLTDVAVALSRRPAFAAAEQTIAGARVQRLTTSAIALELSAWDSTQLYREAVSSTEREFDLTLVPYYPWGNRGYTEMTVWLPVR